MVSWLLWHLYTLYKCQWSWCTLIIYQLIDILNNIKSCSPTYMHSCTTYIIIYNSIMLYVCTTYKLIYYLNFFFIFADLVKVANYMLYILYILLYVTYIIWYLVPSKYIILLSLGCLSTSRSKKEVSTVKVFISYKTASTTTI